MLQTRVWVVDKVKMGNGFMQTVLSVIQRMAVTFVCLMCLANASSALDVTYSSISIKPFAEKEGSRRSLHLRICLNDVRVSGASYFGRNCARAKVEKGPGEGPWSNVIFESRYFSAFDIVTKERYKDNYKF